MSLSQTWTERTWKSVHTCSKYQSSNVRICSSVLRKEEAVTLGLITGHINYQLCKKKNLNSWWFSKLFYFFARLIPASLKIQLNNHVRAIISPILSMLRLSSPVSYFDTVSGDITAQEIHLADWLALILLLSNYSLIRWDCCGYTATVLKR